MGKQFDISIGHFEEACRQGTCVNNFGGAAYRTRLNNAFEGIKAVYLHACKVDDEEMGRKPAMTSPADKDALVKVLQMVVRQNSCDMVLTGEELRRVEDAIAHLTAPVEASIGEMREGGVVWFGGNPHSFPVGTQFYAAPLPQSAPVSLNVTCKTCGGLGVVPDGVVTCHDDGTPFTNGPVQAVKDCPDCIAHQAPVSREAVIDVFDAAVDNELPSVSTVEYNSHEICKHFANKVRERILTAHPAEPAGKESGNG